MIPKSYLLLAWSKLIFFFINLIAIYLFLKGHNEPGGGFIAGIASGISLVFIYITLGYAKTKKIICINPLILASSGLLIAYSTALIPTLFSYPFLFHKMLHIHLPILGELHIGTPLLFDFGVYLVVVGITASITLTFDQSQNKSWV